MSAFAFTLKGITPLLMHHDDVEAADELAAWRKDPANKALKVAGDDRSPAWTWQTYLYSDGEKICIPSDNVMVALRTGGSKVPTGKGQATFKVLSQTGLFIAKMACDFLSRGKPVPVADIVALRELPFSRQAAAARDMGFALDVRRARVERKKHVRVRPRFDTWEVRGVVEVTDPAIGREALERIFEYAGRAGLGDWRPSSPESPGNRGMFAATLKPA